MLCCNVIQSLHISVLQCFCYLTSSWLHQDNTVGIGHCSISIVFNAFILYFSEMGTELPKTHDSSGDSDSNSDSEVGYFITFIKSNYYN